MLFSKIYSDKYLLMPIAQWHKRRLDAATFDDEKHAMTPSALFGEQCDNALRIGRVAQIREKVTDP